MTIPTDETIEREERQDALTMRLLALEIPDGLTHREVVGAYLQAAILKADIKDDEEEVYQSFLSELVDAGSDILD